MLQIIKNILLEYVDMAEEDITPDLNPFRDMYLNSYDFISIIGRLEDELGVRINERDIRKLQNIGDLDAYLREKMKEQE